MDGATGLGSGFVIQAEVSDDIGISMVEIRIDGVLAFTKEAPPWGWAAPATLTPGSHTIEITAYDIAGTTTKDSITASIGAPCTNNSMCPAGNLCAGGTCVLGGGAAGGLGTSCEGNNDCSSGICAGDGAGTQYCVISCAADQESCPSGFDCLSNVCWPGAEEGICSVGSSGRRNTAPTFLLLGLAALWITRRRRSAK
jgi:MYXO-CTERM domain-containing protein